MIRLERDGEVFEIRDRIPLLPLRDVVIFPYMTIPLLVGRIPSVNAIEAAVQRELTEEIGYRAARLTHVSTYNTSKSIMDETAHLFIGEDLVQAALPPDETEFIDVRPFPFSEALRMVLSGDIVDSMTIIAVLHAARLKGV